MLKNIRAFEVAACEIRLDRLNQTAMGSVRQVPLNGSMAGQHPRPSTLVRVLRTKIKYRSESVPMLAVKIKTRQLDGSVVLNNSQSAVRCAEIQPYSPEHPMGPFYKRNNWTKFSPLF
jgi:hypothetical protein